MSEETAGAWSDMTEDEASVIQNARVKHDTGKYEALARLADKQQKRIATLEAQNALLRPVAEAAKIWDYWDAQDALQAAIDGGALGEGE